MATMYYRPYSMEQPAQDDLPAYDAMENVIPEYKYIFIPKGGSTLPRDNLPASSVKVGDGAAASGSQGNAGNLASSSTTALQKNAEKLDEATSNLLDHQMHELENYRTAIRRMGQDILQLRRQVAELESQNSMLRRNISHYDDATRLLSDTSEMDGLTKTELVERYVAMKQNMASVNAELRDYKDRTQKLQNELIRKNDKEKHYLQVTRAHMSQQELVHRLQDRILKASKLEEACLQQEQVIEKLERLLHQRIEQERLNAANSQIGDASKTLVSWDAHESLLMENKRLREQIDFIRHQQAKTSEDSQKLDEEKLYLIEQIERANARIESLEKQLADLSRNWGREKAKLQIRLNEVEVGVDRTTSLSSIFPIKPRTNEVDEVFMTRRSRCSSRRSPHLEPISR